MDSGNYIIYDPNTGRVTRKESKRNCSNRRNCCPPPPQMPCNYMQQPQTQLPQTINMPNICFPSTIQSQLQCQQPQQLQIQPNSDVYINALKTVLQQCGINNQTPQVVPQIVPQIVPQVVPQPITYPQIIPQQPPPLPQPQIIPQPPLPQPPYIYTGGQPYVIPSQPPMPMPIPSQPPMPIPSQPPMPMPIPAQPPYVYPGQPQVPGQPGYYGGGGGGYYPPYWSGYGYRSDLKKTNIKDGETPPPQGSNETQTQTQPAKSSV